MSKKFPWVAWNASTDGTNIYFGPGITLLEEIYSSNDDDEDIEAEG